MKKIIRLFSFFIVFLIGGIFYTLSVKAEPAPTLDASMFNVVTNTASDFFQLGLVPQGLSPFTDDLLTVWNPWNAGGALLSFDINDCEIEELNAEQKITLLDSYSIIDSSNVSVTVNSPIYSVHFDNGYFDGYAYVDDQGKLLSYTNDLGGHLLQLKYGGSIKSQSDWEQLLQSTATQVYEANFNLYENPSLIQGDYSYYLFNGQDKYGQPYVASEIYVANQYQPGVIVPVATQGTITSWYTNNPDLVIFNLVYGSDVSWTGYQVKTGTYKKNNISYQYYVIGFPPKSNTNTYANWASGVGPFSCTFAKSGVNYNSSYENNSSSSVAFKPLQIPEGSEIINYNYYYDPTEISRLEQELNNLTQQLNSNFNSNQQLSDNNFPFYYPTNNVQGDPSNIPFPNVENYPGYNPMPSNRPEYDPAVNPSITNPYPQIDPSGITNNIPFITGLQNKFPFSIPFDIYNIIKGLDVPREIPVLEYEIEFPVIDYTWEISIDLTMYDSTATLFRSLFLIVFIIGLAVFSYNHFFGS